MKQLMIEYFWHLVFLLATVWYFGFVSGKWWEQVKNEEMPDNDEEMW